MGDARATDMGQRRGEVNIGQLMREEYGRGKVFNIGFTTHTGTVAAADDWDTPVQLKDVRKSMPGSWEHLFHKAAMPEFALDLRSGSQDLRAALEGPLLERAIGVIYRPRTERQSHYFYASLSNQFDAVIHLDETSGAQASFDLLGARLGRMVHRGSRPVQPGGGWFIAGPANSSNTPDPGPGLQH